MKSNKFGNALLLAVAMAGPSLALDSFNQKAQAQFAGLTFACNNPGPGQEVFPGSPNALIASPNLGLASFPTQRTIAVFGNVAQSNGTMADRASRCLQAMLQLNTLAATAHPGFGITYQTFANRGGATICLVPMQFSGARACGGDSTPLFNIFPNSSPEARAAEIVQSLSGPGGFVTGVPMEPVVSGQL